jgi:hypothetical protein
MGDLRGGLVDLGPMHGVTDLAVKMSDCVRPGLAMAGSRHGRVTSARVGPAAAATRAASGFGSVI